MTRKSLIVLSLCLLLGAGIAVYVWASGCCPDDNLCNGTVTGLGECEFLFNVDHDRDNGGGSHEVHLKIKKSGDETYDAFMMEVQSVWPYPVCVTFGKSLDLEATTAYLYYFECATEGCGRDPSSGAYNFNTGNCN